MNPNSVEAESLIHIKNIYEQEKSIRALATNTNRGRPHFAATYAKRK